MPLLVYKKYKRVWYSPKNISSLENISSFGLSILGVAATSTSVFISGQNIPLIAVGMFAYIFNQLAFSIENSKKREENEDAIKEFKDIIKRVPLQFPYVGANKLSNFMNMIDFSKNYLEPYFETNGIEDIPILKPLKKRWAAEGYSASNIAKKIEELEIFNAKKVCIQGSSAQLFFFQGILSQPNHTQNNCEYPALIKLRYQAEGHDGIAEQIKKDYHTFISDAPSIDWRADQLENLDAVNGTNFYGKFFFKDQKGKVYLTAEIYAVVVSLALASAGTALAIYSQSINNISLTFKILATIFSVLGAIIMYSNQLAIRHKLKKSGATFINGTKTIREYNDKSLAALDRDLREDKAVFDMNNKINDMIGEKIRPLVTLGHNIEQNQAQHREPTSINDIEDALKKLARGVWLGEPLDTIEQLIQVVGNELEPAFEEIKRRAKERSVLRKKVAAQVSISSATATNLVLPMYTRSSDRQERPRSSVISVEDQAAAHDGNNREESLEPSASNHTLSR